MIRSGAAWVRGRRKLQRRCDGDVAAFGHSVARVENQVEQSALDELAVDEGRRKLFGDVKFGPDIWRENTGESRLK
jgi:hypothetical protein